MTTAEFIHQLKEDRSGALQRLFEAAVAEWLKIGPQEVARVLALWANRPDVIRSAPPILVLGTSDQEILEHAEHYGLVRDPDPEKTAVRTYRVEQYEIWSHAYRVDAASEGEAVRKVLQGGLLAMADKLTLIGLLNERGLSTSVYPDVAAAVDMADYPFIPSIRSVEEA